MIYFISPGGFKIVQGSNPLNFIIMRKLINSVAYPIVCVVIGLFSLILSTAINNLNIASVFLFIFAISFVLSLLPCVVAEKE